MNKEKYIKCCYCRWLIGGKCLNTDAFDIKESCDIIEDMSQILYEYDCVSLNGVPIKDPTEFSCRYFC